MDPIAFLILPNTHFDWLQMTHWSFISTTWCQLCCLFTNLCNNGCLSSKHWVNNIRGLLHKLIFFLIISFMDQFTPEKFNRPAAMCMTENRTVTLQFTCFFLLLSFRMYFSRAYWCGFSSDNKLPLPCCRMSPVMWCFFWFFFTKRLEL